MANMGRGSPDAVVMCALLLCCGCTCVSKAQESSPTAGTASDTQGGQTGSATGQASGTATGTELIQEEAGNRDITYLRTRAVFRYDYKEQDGPTESNRFRLRLVYGFGANQRFGMAVNVPVVWMQTPTGTVFGSSDTDVTAGVVVYQTSKQLRTGFIAEATCRLRAKTR